MKNKRPAQLLLFIIWVVLLVLPVAVFAQYKPQGDSNYYVTYPQKLTTRFYFSKKFTSLDFAALDKSNDLEYRANTNLTMGVGATYGNYSLNLSYGFGFLNPDTEKGKTKSMDLEVHVFPNKWAIDLLAIRHKGLYIDPKGYATTPNNYYYRPDAVMTLGGIAAYRVANSKKFSYNAAMIQSERQKKSAGSLLYGGEVYYGSLKSDSGLIPKQKENLFAQGGINKMQFFTIGAGGGYAYTLVMGKHFFVMGSAIANLDVHFSSEHNDGNSSNRTTVMPSVNYKTAIGYNTDKWNFTANWVANTLWVKGASAAKAYTIPTGNYRIMLAKRIGLKRK